MWSGWHHIDEVRAGVCRPVGRRHCAHLDGPDARHGRRGLPPVSRYSVCGTAGGAAALAATAAGGEVAGDVGRHQTGPAVHAGHRTQPACGQADQRKLPHAQRVGPAARTRHRQACGDGVDPWRRLRQRQWRHLLLALAGRQGPHRRRHDQLPAGRAGISWPTRHSVRRATSETTGWPTSRPHCAGSATTSPISAAIRTR